MKHYGGISSKLSLWKQFENSGETTVFEFIPKTKTEKKFCANFPLFFTTPDGKMFADVITAVSECFQIHFDV